MKDNRYFEGLIEISDEVLEMLVALTALDIKGVVGMSATFGDDVVNLLGLKNKGEGAKIHHADDGTISVSVYIVVNYGYRIPDIALRLQERIKTVLKEDAGKQVSSVDIYVQNIVFDNNPIRNGCR